MKNEWRLEVAQQRTTRVEKWLIPIHTTALAIRMTIARALAAALDRGIQRNRIWSGVAFVGIEESRLIFGLSPWDRDKNEMPIGPPLYKPAPKSAWSVVPARMVTI